MSNALESILKQYEKNTSTTTNQTKKVYDLKNYFTTHLKDKEKSVTKKIRILPTSDGSSPFVEMYGHKIQVDGEWKTFPCLKHEKNQDCPFCEAREELLSTGREQDKELAKKYSARKMYVVKVIDRDNEQDGPKFWRFNHDYRKQGILDKIYGILQAVNRDITDVDTGRDLLVMISKDQNNRPVVQQISQLDPSKLTEDEDLKASWLEDERTWEDVYSVKSYDYLEIIVKGGIPQWSKELEKFVDKASISESEAEDDSEITLGVPEVKPTIKVSTATKDESKKAVISDNNESDDLPF